MMVLNADIVGNLREKYGDAFYLLDSEQFKSNFLELKEAFSSVYPHFNIAYSYKTNYIPKLCKIVDELGGYAEVVSEMELELALKVGVDARKIIWNGPVKNPEKIEKLLVAGGTVNIDSINEAEVIEKIAERYLDKIFNIGIRCNYDVNDGVVSRFGFDVDGEDFVKTLNIISSRKNLRLINFQCHFAKRQLEYWKTRAEGMVKLIDRIGIVPKRIDLGGGMFGKMEDSLKKQFKSQIPNYADYARVAATVLAERFKNEEYPPELLIEPGSALVGDSMKFIGTIKTIKNIRGKNIASVLGSQKNISMSGVNPPIEIISMGNDSVYYDGLDIVGYTCIENDIIYKNFSGNLAIGDVLVVSNCGSYSLVMKPPFILPNFPVLDICNKRVEVIKRAETFNDIFQTFNF